ncbi:MAG TPA: hypothetical protein VG713_17385 [Pirellulales bacterium]|nr:hypothetical protein [Pirellulales bacterium]
MVRRLLISAGASTLAALLSLATPGGHAHAAWPDNPQLRVPTPVCRKHACGMDHSVPYDRGVAVLSPVESPDRYQIAVGGKPRRVPYYVDYCPHWRLGPRVCVPGNGLKYLPPQAWIAGAMPSYAGPDGAPPEPNGYGGYSGSSQLDESMLLQLGGNSSGATDAEHVDQAPDMVDLIESSRDCYPRCIRCRR